MPTTTELRLTVEISMVFNLPWTHRPGMEGAFVLLGMMSQDKMKTDSFVTGGSSNLLDLCGAPKGEWIQTEESHPDVRMYLNKAV